MTSPVERAKEARALAATARRLAGNLLSEADQGRFRQVASDLDGEAAEFEQEAKLAP